MAEKLSLYELQMIIRDSLYISLPDMYWVTGEISEIKQNYAGHCYLELVEKQPDDINLRARVRAVIWCKKFSFLKSFFESSTGETLREGLKILVRVKIEYHELYGLSLVICDIDPSYTAGDLAVKRRMIISRLESEGVFTMNKENCPPVVVQKIAVISSLKAAGYTDFIKHLNSNSFGYVYYTRLFESPMQGADTEQGILKALDRIAELAHLFDVVVVIRGGGSQADLSWFDNYNIAYHITQFPLPVFTGIGHEKDMSVADMVACMAFKTPTAVANYIIDRTAETDARLNEIWNSIRERSRTIFESNKSRLDAAAIRLQPMARILISEIRELLSGKSLRLVNSGKTFTREAGLIPADCLSRLQSGTRTLIAAKSAFLGQSEKTLEILSPEKVLARGYTITYRNGIVVKESKDLFEDDLMETKFRDGLISSRVVKNLNRKHDELND
ncbi:MAG TPA: exodeoxyribonuclease VII large subunit [Bacteroidales bacterium]|nr:exodeoxyribonuclease VII large subunit [Bacteroidales bacterium]